MQKFEHELTAIRERLLAMGGQAEQMIAWASDALLKRDQAIAAKVMEAEGILDRFQIEVDGEAIRLITIYTPTAKDLRFLLMVVRINTELERIGDQAVNNCEYVKMFVSDPPPKTLRDLARMSELTREMVRGALHALAHEDLTMAQHVATLDDQVDELDRQTFSDLLLERSDDPDLIKRSMSLILFARSLERIADHAVNICEEVVYLVKGEDIRHQT